MPQPPRYSRRSGKSDPVPAPAPETGFADPELSYAPHAFWFWNGPLPAGRIAEMAAGMCRQRLNPGYVHARFRPEGDSAAWNEQSWIDATRRWISDEWFNAFEASLEQTAQAGMHMTYTTGEPNIPKHQILARCPGLKAQSVGAAVFDVQGGAGFEVPESLFTVAARMEEGRIVSSSLRLAGEGAPFVWKAPEGAAWRLYVFTKYHDYTSSGSPVNFLDRRFAEVWMDVEHRKYEARVSAHFGKAMGGIFIDHEGCYGYKLAWSDDLPREYAARKGRDLRLWLPLMLDEDAEGLWGKARWDWFDTVTHLYADCLLKPIVEWCGGRNMHVTCHFWETSLFEQAVQVGSFFNAQRSYPFPGTDNLFLSILEPRNSKETQSVCEFEGRQSMSEILGIAGWHATPATLKKAANAAVAWGLTQLVPHAISTGRDLLAVSYPPDFMDWNPYWRYLHLWTDFSRRACYVNDHGRLRAETLLFCPMDSVWALLGDGFFDPAKPHHFYFEKGKGLADARHAAEITEIEEAYSRAIADLSAARVEYLIADHVYLGQMEPAGEGSLAYGEFAFRSLVLPPLWLVPLEAARKAVALARSGGRVFALGRLPEGSAENGMRDPVMIGLMEELRAAPGFVDASEGLGEWIGSAGLEPCLRFDRGEFPLLASHRTVNGRSFLWLANNEPERHKFAARVRGASGEASLWNCETGEKRVIPSEDFPGESRVALDMEPYEAFWLVHDPAKPALPRRRGLPAPRPVVMFDGLWTVRVDPADQPPPVKELAAPQWLLEGNARRPLESWLRWGLGKFSGYVDYTANFELDEVAGTETLDLGQVSHMAEVWINGRWAGERLWPPFRFAAGRFLKPGVNTIRVRVGNLILNAVTQFEDYNWKWFKPPADAQLDAGLYGPVTIRR